MTWIGDHRDRGPYHVHVVRDGRTVCKFDLERMIAMEGKVTRRIRSLIDELLEEGKL